MICDFCKNTIPDNSFSCPYCGSLVRKSVSSTENPVISLEQQAEIGNYKMSSNYKLPSNNSGEDDPFLYKDISRQSFAAQKFTSSNIKTSLGVVIQSIDTSNGKKYTMGNNETGKTVTQSMQSKGKVVLEKKRNAVSLSKEKQKVRLSKEISPGGFIDYTELNSSSDSPERPDGCVEIEPGLTKNQILSLHNLKSIRTPFYASILLLYSSMLVMLFDFSVISSLYMVTNVLLVLLFTYGIQFKHNYSCAVACASFGFAFSITGLLFYNSVHGLLILLGGLLAVNSIKKLNVLWTQYQETGRLPLNP